MGVIIDGTGHRYSSIKEKKDKLEKLGYDTYMVFVWTDLETALKKEMNKDQEHYRQILLKLHGEIP